MNLGLSLTHEALLSMWNIEGIVVSVERNCLF